MQNFIFMKIIILTFQFFNRGEKIKWTYIFWYHYDLYKEKIFFNNTDVWCFDLFIEEKEKYNDKCFSISLWFVQEKKTMLLLNDSVFRFSYVVLLLSIRKWISK